MVANMTMRVFRTVTWNGLFSANLGGFHKNMIAFDRKLGTFFDGVQPFITIIYYNAKRLKVMLSQRGCRQTGEILC